MIAALCACQRHVHRGPVPPTHPRSGLVDPFIGTDDGDAPDPPPGDSGGAVFPGATVPFGMIQWSPDTGPTAEFGYHYRDDHIRGFTVTHLSGTGCPAMLDFPFLPATIAPTSSESVFDARQAATFRHADELATPGYYKVTLGSGVTVELTASQRAGAARFSFPAKTTPGLLIQASKTVTDRAAEVSRGELRVVSPTRLVASMTSKRFCGHASSYTIHLAVEFDQPIVSSSSWRGDAWTTSARDIRGPRSGLWLRFASQNVGATIAISYVSTANAIANLEASLGPSFDQRRAAAAELWKTALGTIEIEGSSESARRTFYTALYHVLLHPNIASDVNGEYMGFDGAVHRAVGYTHYQTFSGWDIYRSWVQLVTLLYPREADDILRSFVTSAQQCGGLPRWTLAHDETGVMIGDPGALIVANAYAFGARGFDARAALDLATKPSARCNRWVIRPFQSLSDRHGYVPNDPKIWGSAAITLEYAVADAALSQLARALGLPDRADALARRSERWKNLFDPSTGYIRPRNANGSWKTPFKPTHQRGFIEGNAAQYTFFVPHDPAGLATALGGAAIAIARLDALFLQLNAGLSLPHFYIGNEPQFATPFLYSRLGAPEKTQAVVHQILTRVFTDLPSGLPGNDDLGATSSWYVWAALGLYPDLPGQPDLALASPLFPTARVHLRDGSILTIEGPGTAPPFQRVELDGIAIDPSSIPLPRLLGGNHRLTFRQDPSLRKALLLRLLRHRELRAVERDLRGARLGTDPQRITDHRDAVDARA
ncbi:MAG: glycoside hydrolase family 92 protein, partial [Deltaproteobacteria bacterium]|nr:glycoside hydrolase family 92 protein [Deltaproteobacteria bacterium]